VHGDFIIGLPGETKETIEKTIDFAKELDARRFRFPGTRVPGTELHDRLSKEAS